MSHRPPLLNPVGYNMSTPIHKDSVAFIPYTPVSMTRGF